jgi:hypothetical protein
MDACRSSGGQCNVTALLVHELFGGDLLENAFARWRAFLQPDRRQSIRFHRSQFRDAIVYMDFPASRAEAERGATNVQLAELRTAFQRSVR